ncbi:MAG TPA: hypothetical protein V6C81_08605 [Planktothrix sp.]|jgi:hypothetical protein
MTILERRSITFGNRFRRWFFHGIRESHKKGSHHQSAWWKVMCLTGVDYFSSLGYAPGIAFVAANVLSPLATVILVLLTLFGALPVYHRVAGESPHGQGSISMLERLLAGWKGKALVLCLLGFAATDFIITITLSAADAAAHVAQNPMAPMWMQNRMGLTMILLVLLGGVFLMGFREAIGVSVVLVIAYLVLNAIVVARGVQLLPTADFQADLHNWWRLLFEKYQSPWHMLTISVLLFPKLALGMSGFETGVAVMPLVKGSDNDDPQLPIQRIKNTRKLLVSAAIIMSIFLLATSFLTCVLIPEHEFGPNGKANGRAIAYLAQIYLGQYFELAYDISSILILWFAGASAMTGLLSLVPRYLPRFGMAPEWARATRPLVVFFTLIGIFVTWWFKADVDAQGGAYATGVLVLMTSAALACTLSVWKEHNFKRFLFLAICLVFVYTTITNCIERPEGLQIASLFILTIFLASLVSRAARATELRVQRIVFDDTAQSFIDEAKGSYMGQIRILAHRPGGTDYATKEKEARETHSIQQPEGNFIFLEVSLKDASDFMEDCLQVQGHIVDGFQVMRCSSPAIPNAIAALLLHLRDYTDTIPNAYFGWTEGNPIGYIFKYIFFGEGETAPVTREILRELEANPKRRPTIHVG